MADQPSSSSRLPARKAKPTMEQLCEGRRYRSLEEAIEAAEDGDTIAFIPPSASDEEDIDDAIAAQEQDLIDIAGFLDVVSPDEDDAVHCEEQVVWRTHLKLEDFLQSERVPTLSETHPLVQTLSPVQLFHLYYTNEVSEMIAAESIRYAKQCGNMLFHVSASEIDSFIMLVLYSSYVKLPRQGMYWGTDFDVALQLPRQTMTRDRFIMIKKYLHFADNCTIDTKANAFAKVQPIFDNLNSALLQFGMLSKCVAVDEQMVSYCGSHPTRQFLKGKPIKRGYKAWPYILNVLKNLLQYIKIHNNTFYCHQTRHCVVLLCDLMISK